MLHGSVVPYTPLLAYNQCMSPYPAALSDLGWVHVLYMQKACWASSMCEWFFSVVLRLAEAKPGRFQMHTRFA